MKIWLSLLAGILMPLLSSAQDPVIYSKTIKVGQSDMIELSERANAWYHENLDQSSDAIIFQQNGVAKITGGGTFPYRGLDAQYTGSVAFQFKLVIDEGRVECEFFDFLHSGSSGQMGFVTKEPKAPFTGLGKRRQMEREWKNLKCKVEEHAQYLIASLQKKLKTSNVGQTTN